MKADLIQTLKELYIYCGVDPQHALSVACLKVREQMKGVQPGPNHIQMILDVEQQVFESLGI
ncbi:MAG: hypothetical protein QNJ46_11515 [Leptolyngbyaceae cyanobacterium MO_188.B28]|nr:hypothetical protein [Leptolyngbyaceae cyanobacterium MO_188.B28]